MRLLTKYQYSLDTLEWIAIAITSPGMNPDDFVDVAKEAYATCLLKQKLESDDRIQKIIKKWSKMIEKYYK